MAASLTLLLVRHGQSEWNAAGLLQGQTPHVPLTELGHRQAAQAAAELAALTASGAGPGALLSSDLRRAVQTAEHCAAATGLSVRTTPALRADRDLARREWAALGISSISFSVQEEGPEPAAHPWPSAATTFARTSR